MRVMPAALHKSRRVIALAQVLRAELLEAGFELPPGDSAAIIVAEKVEQVANQLGVTTRTVLASYIDESHMPGLAKAVATQMGELTEILDDAPAVPVGLRRGYSVHAAFGVCIALALQNLEHRNAMIVVKDAGDSTAHLAFAMLSSSDDPVQVGGMTLAIGRKVITMTIEMIHSGQWRCTCRQQHANPRTCPIAERLAIDLGILGGWVQDAA